LRETIDTPQRMSDALLEWYDANAREMPWRVAPQARRAGVCPDPYRIWLSEVMLQQTTVAAVRSYFAKFTTLWPDVRALAAAQDADVMAAWAGLGYYARARNLLKCARVVAHDLDGEFPRSNAALLKLPGIGPYTAAAVGAIAFDLPETVVDGNVERVMARLHGVQTPLPISKPELTGLAAGLTPIRRPGDYAQAVMDLGATVCTPRNPACGLCPWRTPCVARRAGDAAQLPRKVPKTPKPVRLGAIYVVHGYWKRAPRRGCWAACLDGRPPTGPKTAPKPCRRWMRRGVKPPQKSVIHSRTFICGCGCSWPFFRWRRRLGTGFLWMAQCLRRQICRQ
jgi:A/G-specific adenine glycosylase